MRAILAFLLSDMLYFAANVQSTTKADCSSFETIPGSSYDLAYGVVDVVNNWANSLSTCQLYFHPSASLAISREPCLLNIRWHLEKNAFKLEFYAYGEQFCLDQRNMTIEPNRNWLWVDGSPCLNVDRSCPIADSVFDNFNGHQDCAVFVVRTVTGITSLVSIDDHWCNLTKVTFLRDSK